MYKYSFLFVILTCSLPAHLVFSLQCPICFSCFSYFSLPVVLTFSFFICFTIPSLFVLLSHSAGFLTPCSISFCSVQVFWALQLVTVLVPGAVFHLYAACKNIDQEEILERPLYTVFYIISVLLRIILEVIAFWLQSHLFGFQVSKYWIILDQNSVEWLSIHHSSILEFIVIVGSLGS